MLDFGMSNAAVISFNDVLYALSQGVIYKYDQVDCQWYPIEYHHLPDGLGVHSDRFITQVEEQKLCSCELPLLMNRGCQCGGK